MVELNEGGHEEEEEGGETRKSQGDKRSNKLPLSRAHLFFHKKHTNMQQGHHNSIKTDRLRSPL